MFDFALAIIITNTVDHHSQGFPNSSKKWGGGGGLMGERRIDFDDSQ